jgi:hypothetical protein
MSGGATSLSDIHRRFKVADFIATVLAKVAVILVEALVIRIAQAFAASANPATA